MFLSLLLKALKPCSLQGARGQRVTYGIQMYTCGKMSHKSSQTLHLSSTLTAEEWQQLPDQMKMITLMLSALQITATRQIPEAKYKPSYTNQPCEWQAANLLGWLRCNCHGGRLPNLWFQQPLSHPGTLIIASIPWASYVRQSRWLMRHSEEVADAGTRVHHPLC